MKRFYPGLDLVRFAAALIVTLFHLAYFGWHKTSSAPADFALKLSGVGSIFSSGWVGVPIFFVLSGFVIAFSATGRTAEQFVNLGGWRLLDFRRRNSVLFPGCVGISGSRRASAYTSWIGPGSGRFSILVTAIGGLLHCPLHTRGLISIVAAARYKFITGDGSQIDIVVAPAVWMIAVCTIAASVFWNDALLYLAVNWQSRILIVGLATYPLYLLHQNIGLAIMKVAQPVGALTALAFALVCVISGSFLVVYLERFPRRLLLAGLSLVSSTNDSSKTHRASVQQLSKE